MPTIQQLVRSRRIQIKKKKLNHQHFEIVLNVGESVLEFIQLHQKNQIQQLEKLQGFD